MCLPCRYPPFEPKMVYAHLGVLVICGVCMSFNMQRRTAAVVHSGQLLYMAWLTFSNKKLKYSEWTRVSLESDLLTHSLFVQ